MTLTSILDGSHPRTRRRPSGSHWPQFLALPRDPMWLVTIPTRSRRAAGTQTFAVRAATAQAAIASASLAAGTSTALLHRRGALIDITAASAVLRD
ncbi:hypothetical protein AB0I39_36910 [Kitasatospora purpeofusca]|uniref:hypothetical protein n=1 Tax=Kitasatospora purpeofusca TaxID=67352 RepID=UPI0033CFFC60